MWERVGGVTAKMLPNCNKWGLIGSLGPGNVREQGSGAPVNAQPCTEDEPRRVQLAMMQSREICGCQFGPVLAASGLTKMDYGNLAPKDD